MNNTFKISYDIDKDIKEPTDREILACREKKKFLTIQECLNEKKRARKKFGIIMRYYKCPICYHYHMSSQVRKIITKPRIKKIKKKDVK